MKHYDTMTAYVGERLCEIIPTDGVATLAARWCLTHDVPA